MTVIDFSFTFDLSALTFKCPHTGSPRSTEWAGEAGMCCLSDSEFTSRRIIRASQGTCRASMLGVLDILLVCFFRQVKKSDSHIKCEKHSSNWASNKRRKPISRAPAQ